MSLVSAAPNNLVQLQYADYCLMVAHLEFGFIIIGMGSVNNRCLREQVYGARAGIRFGAAWLMI